MTAEPTPRLVARLLADHALDAVMIGNAAADGTAPPSRRST
jgi:hypothetical protein